MKSDSVPAVRAEWDHFFFRYPIVGLRLQGWFAKEPVQRNGAYETVTCLASGTVHFVNPKTGKTIGESDEDRSRPCL
jgi:hypothetical protein